MAGSVFISWSGSRSHNVAILLKLFLESVLPAPKLFLSSEDIRDGKPWFTEIAKAIEESDAGIVVVTPENKLKPWLHFEAGAIAKRVQESHMIPLLCGIAIGELADTPLVQYQTRTLDRAGVLSICQTVATALSLATEDIERKFDVWWKELGDQLLEASGAPDVEKAPVEISLSDISAQLDGAVAVINSMASDLRGMRDQSNYLNNFNRKIGSQRDYYWLDDRNLSDNLLVLRNPSDINFSRKNIRQMLETFIERLPENDASLTKNAISDSKDEPERSASKGKPQGNRGSTSRKSQ